MQIITTRQELRKQVEACKRQGKTIGLVPTMGALHQGHASLVRRAVSENDVCFVSVFVNPTQFNNKEDLAKYPRNIRRDAELLSEIGVHFIFAPAPEEMYSADEMNTTFEFDFAGLDQVMEGKMRPGHFNGVVQVVSRLFYLVEPDRAYFGEKDYQQLAIIHYMVERSPMAGTFYNLKIICCPLVVGLGVEQPQRAVERAGEADRTRYLSDTVCQPRMGKDAVCTGSGAESDRYD